MRYLRLFLCVLACSVRADTFQDLSAQATAARQANDIPQAIELYGKALGVNPGWQEGWWFLGTLLYDSDQYARGRDAFRRFVDLNAQAAPGWAFLGLCEFETGDHVNALQHIERGLLMGADKELQLAPVLRYHEALLLTRLGDFDQALQKYSELIRRMQRERIDESMLISVGVAALRSPSLPKDVADRDRELYIEAGKAASYTFVGDYAQADAAFDKLLQNYPAVPNVHYMRGVYLMARNPDEAFEEFKRELEVSPSNTAADAMMAWGLLTRGDSGEALPYAEKAAQKTGSSPFAKYLLGRALAETGALQRGIAYLQDAENADSGNADVHISLAAAYARVGRPMEARREREVAMQMESESRPVVHP
jgi:tetratricopeptide (TPR) repeat protein